jgi:hypothetical protein
VLNIEVVLEQSSAVLGSNIMSKSEVTSAALKGATGISAIAIGFERFGATYSPVRSVTDRERIGETEVAQAFFLSSLPIGDARTTRGLGRIAGLEGQGIYPASFRNSVS